MTCIDNGDIVGTLFIDFRKPSETRGYPYPVCKTEVSNMSRELILYRVKEGVFGTLKVGSCPNDDSSVQILFCPFLCSI